MLCTVLMTVLGSLRNQWHIDEVFSYGLSNSYDRPFLFHWFGGIENIDDGEDNGSVLEDEEHKFIYQWHTPEEFKDYITVQPDERFTYDNVYKNQELDVHPPLYYFILHTICSFFPDVFSKWFALIPNIICFVLSMLLLYKIAKELTDSEYKSIAVMAFWGISRGAVNSTIFLRMYMLMIVLALISAYLHILLIKKETLSVKYVILIAITNIAGFLTQYYLYIYAFFFAAVTCFLFLLRKNWKQIFVYAGPVLLSVVVALIIFPQSIKHATNGAHGETAMNSLGNFLRLFHKQLMFIQYTLQDCLGINVNENNSIFATILAITLSIAAITLTILFFKWFKKFKAQGGELDGIVKKIFLRMQEYKISQYILIYASTIITGLFIAILTPRMYLFQDRYFFVIMPLCSMIICLSLITLAEKVLANIKVIGKYAVPVVLCVMFAAGAIGHIPENKFLCQQVGTLDINEVVKDRVCFLVTERDYHIHQFAPVFSTCEAVYQAHEPDDILSSEIEKLDSPDGAIIMISLDDMELDEADAYVQSLDREIEYVDLVFSGKDAWSDGYYLYNIK